MCPTGVHLVLGNYLRLVQHCVFFSASHFARPFVTIIEGGVSFRFIPCHLIYLHLFLLVCILARAHCEHLAFSPVSIRDRSNVH